MVLQKTLKNSQKILRKMKLASLWYMRLRSKNHLYFYKSAMNSLKINNSIYTSIEINNILRINLTKQVQVCVLKSTNSVERS